MSSMHHKWRTLQGCRRALLSVAILSLVGGCVFTPRFEPTTAEGAECKQDCAHNMQLCAGSSYTCDRSYGKCIEACVDADRVKKGLES